jgi:hypothetical protein
MYRDRSFRRRNDQAQVQKFYYYRARPPAATATLASSSHDATAEPPLKQPYILLQCAFKPQLRIAQVSAMQFGARPCSTRCSLLLLVCVLATVAISCTSVAARSAQAEGSLNDLPPSVGRRLQQSFISHSPAPTTSQSRRLLQETTVHATASMTTTDEGHGEPQAAQLLVVVFLCVKSPDANMNAVSSAAHTSSPPTTQAETTAHGASQASVLLVVV